jgi:hypothetical protein
MLRPHSFGTAAVELSSGVLIHCYVHCYVHKAIKDVDTDRLSKSGVERRANSIERERYRLGTPGPSGVTAECWVAGSGMESSGIAHTTSLRLGT